jgi:hypothetical protein
MNWSFVNNRFAHSSQSYDINVKLSAPVHAIKTYEGVEMYIHSMLMAAVDGVSGQLHSPAAFSW